MTKLSTQPYKGTRDFYPPEQSLQQYLFDTMRMTAEQYGYEEYNASILEATDLYKAKTGEEIVNEQTYSFEDRGGRDVTIRPEMTPTIARMVAAKRKELAYPLRWFSIPNLFRYEKPQRGRLREHWQLNVDCVGVDTIDAEIEVISVAYDIMAAFGAQPDSFRIRINNRKLVNVMLHDVLGLDEDKSHSVSKLIDKMHKMKEGAFVAAISDIVGDEKAAELEKLLQVKEVKDLPKDMQDHESVKDVLALMSALQKNGIHNAVYDPTLMRGFDYYTGVVFEIFDTHPDNNRSLFGGGRYDGLVGIFGVDPVAAVGFGMGDVTIKDYLETYGLLPEYEPATQVHVCVLDEESVQYARDLAKEMRDGGLAVALNTSAKKPAQHIKVAEKQSIPYIIFIGEDEVAQNKLEVKHLASRETLSIDRKSVVQTVLNHISQ
ncbi:MAG: histidine--tRNA ligase [Patescibacteria group bacterium]